MLKKIALLSLMTLGINQALANEVSLPSVNFNFDIKTISSQSTYKPLLAFVDEGKTYIKFPPTVTANNIPTILVDHLENAPAPTISWENGYAVINQPSSEIKIYQPKSKKLLYRLTLSSHFDYSDIAPSPDILPYEYAGFFIGANVGMSNIDNRGASAAGGLSLGYNWHFVKGFLAGFEVVADYNGKSKKDNIEAKSVDFGLLLRTKYQFESGFNITGKAGIVYVDNSRKLANGEDDVNVKKSITPKIGLEAGYLFQNGIGLNIGYGHIFSSSKILSVNSYTVGMSYIF